MPSPHAPASLYSFPSEGGPSNQLQNPEYRQKLQALLENAKARLGENPETWEKYEIAIRILSLEQTEPLRLARLYLQAAWTARDRAVDVYKGLEGPIKAWGTPSRRKRGTQKPDLSPATQRILHYNLARIAHRSGFSEIRDTHLTAFESIGTLSHRKQKPCNAFAAWRETSSLSTSKSSRTSWRCTLPPPPTAKVPAGHITSEPTLLGEQATFQRPSPTTRPSWPRIMQTSAFSS